MNSVLISNSRLEIKNYDVRGLNVLELVDKEKMMYQFVVLETHEGELATSLTRGIKSLEIDGKFDTAYVIIKNKNLSGAIEYKPEEKAVLLKVISAVPINFLGMMEELVHATGHEGVIDYFYQAIGGEINGFRKYCKDEARMDYDAVKKNYPKVYKKGHRYSIYQLCKDLIADHAKVMLDGAEKYKRITKSKTKKPENIKKAEDQWLDICNIVGNRERANLSIQIKTKVRIDIPENEVGIEPRSLELDTIKNLALVKDGLHNMKLLAVSVSPKLAHKLRAVGCIKKRMFFKNWLILDLDTLPVISKKELTGISVEKIAELEAKLQSATFAANYLTIKGGGKKPVKKDPKKLSKQEQFLRSLGIYDGVYFPVNEKVVAEGNDYEAISVDANIHGIPDDSWDYFLDYIKNKGNITKRTKYKSNIMTLLKAIDDNNMTLEEAIKLKKKISTELRDMKYRAILAKCNFNRGLPIKVDLEGVNVDVSWKCVLKKIPV